LIIPLATLLKSLKQATQPSEQTAWSFIGGARRAGGSRVRLCSWSLGAGLEKSARRQQAEKRYHKRFFHHSTRQSQTIVPKDTIVSLARRQCSKKKRQLGLNRSVDDGLRRPAGSTWLALEIIVAERVARAPRFLIGFGVACPYSANMGTSVNWRKNGSI
jgi:hypothetical protein